MLWFNLRPASAGDPRRRWLQHRDFRRAVAHSIDRREFVDTVYLGAAVPADGIISPANTEWRADAAAPAFDVTAARSLLASLRLISRDRDGTLRDANGDPARFTLLTQAGNASLERGAVVIRESLAKEGVRVEVAALEVGELMHRVMRGDYDAVYFRLLATDTDPALNLDFWLSSGDAHIWHPAQRTPSTSWEAAIDGLMEQVSTVRDTNRRHELFAEVQRIMATEVPIMCFAFPRLSYAMRARVDATPARFHPPLLWNPTGIALRPPPH